MKLALTASAIAVMFSTVAFADETGVAAEAQKGVQRSYEIYEATVRETGMSGIEDAVTDCYKKQAANPTVENLGACAALDKRAKDEDEAFAQVHHMPQVGFFKGSKPANRMKAALKKLNLSVEDSREVMRVIAAS